MDPPRTAAGRAGLRALLADPGSSLIALDYDGTLAPIVARPQDAVPAPGAVAALYTLAERYGLALVTGRPADAVVELGGLGAIPGLTVLGQYGVQRWHAGVLQQEPPHGGLDQLRPRLTHLPTGATLEDKGQSLVVHTRNATDPAALLAELRPRLAALATDAGLELHDGRLVLELRPPGHDKGKALETLVADRRAVLFAGDDVGDLPAFDAVDRLRTKGGEAVLVCSDSPETPAELRRRADLVLPGPAGVVAFLQELGRR